MSLRKALWTTGLMGLYIVTVGGLLHSNGLRHVDTLKRIGSLEGKVSSLELKERNRNRRLRQRLAGIEAITRDVEHFGEAIDKKYDYDSSLMDDREGDLEALTQCIYKLRIQSRFKITSDDGKERYVTGKRRASGFFFPGNYLLTNHHVVDYPTKSFKRSLPFSDRFKKIERVKEEVYVQVGKKWHKLEYVMDKPGYDVVVMAAPKDIEMNTYPFEMGKSSELRMRHFLYLLGHPSYDIPLFRSGEVSNTKGIRLTKKGYVKKHVFMASNGVNPGDSGHPIFALRDGRPEIVGICQIKATGSYERVGGIIGIDHIKEMVRKELDANPEKLKEHGKLYEIFTGKRQFF